MKDVEVWAHCGIGSLRRTGTATTDADGRYELRFGPGFFFADNETQLQAATISVHKPGYFERNLHRQGDLVAAFKLPEGEIGWGKKTKDDVFLPGQPKEINFVMLPAAKASGTLVDKEGNPLAGYRMSLTGAELPPSSGALASGGKTDEKGRFEFRDIPTGYQFQILIKPPKAEPPWLAWASAPLEFRDPGQRDFVAGLPGQVWLADRFEIDLAGSGLNWREALRLAAKSKSDFRTTDGIRTETKDSEIYHHVSRLRMLLGPVASSEK